ncbi:MAG: hypothetical protein V4510_05205 [bacterium]
MAVRPARPAHVAAGWVVVVSLSLSALPLASGFVLSSTATNGTPNDPSDDIQSPLRWSAATGALTASGQRGLGGGLEYSIAPDFCANLLPRFTLEPELTCDQLRSATEQALNVWSQGQSALHFTDVSTSLPPALPNDTTSLGGAEFDLFAMDPAQYPALASFGAFTAYFPEAASPVLTNGATGKGERLAAVDIVFSTRSPMCFVLAAALAAGNCNHYASLVTHEAGHGLGLDHPNRFPDRNFDNDGDPTDVLAIDCQDPAAGLHLSAPAAATLMNSEAPERVHANLTNDDVGGRDFLYPCATGPSPAGPQPSAMSSNPPPATSNGTPGKGQPSGNKANGASSGGLASPARSTPDAAAAVPALLAALAFVRSRRLRGCPQTP